jgi:hypothetical protein
VVAEARGRGNTAKAAGLCSAMRRDADLLAHVEV